MQNSSKLGLDFGKVESAKAVSKKIAADVQQFVDRYTTVAVERTLCRLIGIDGVDENAVPLPNVVVDEVKEKLQSLGLQLKASPLGFDANNLEGGTFFSPDDE